uniref:Uncharacterized protein n=1 Tax=Nicotiana tabacum TaxID=4097 RepID=A0A1S4C0N6_TOBAC|nr:PREDICTED: uncharacterized protein LOC107813815 [Nicotiana tabacum]
MGTPADPNPARISERDYASHNWEDNFGRRNPHQIQICDGFESSLTANPSSSPYGDPTVKARFSTHNGMPAIIFKGSDYYGVMAEECKRTIAGKFLRTRPQIEKIRTKFAEKISVKR